MLLIQKITHQKKSENMCNKFVSIILGALSIFGMISCDQTNTQTVLKKTTSVYITDESLTISDNNKEAFELQIKLDEHISYTKEVETNQETSFLSLLKTNSELNNEIALLLAQNNGNISVNLTLPNVFDTTIVFHLDMNDMPEYSTKVLSGKCASLTGVFDAENIESDIIKWLYRKKLKNVGEETIDNMRLYLKELNSNDYKQYVTIEEIPVVTSFKGINYKVSSDLVADNYYLFACKYEKDLEEFVEEMVSLKFEGAVHSLSQPISCYRSAESSGTNCIFLVGINKDWNYSVAPVGLISIDDVMPAQIGGVRRRGESDMYRFDDADLLLQRNKIIIRMPSQVPCVTGYANLLTREWSGNGISCNVNFEVIFSGDIKSITLLREDNLAKWLGKGKKEIDLQDKTSPYLFSYELHLEDGDNYVPVIVTDLRGNKMEFQYNVGCESKPNNTPQINIDNNVNVN